MRQSQTIILAGFMVLAAWMLPGTAMAADFPQVPAAGQEELLSEEESGRLMQLALYHLIKQGDYQEIEMLLKKLDQAETPEGLYMIGAAYQYAGKGEDALRYLQKAAAQGNPLAYSQMGEIYMQGAIVPQDLPKAIQMFEKGAAGGSTASMTYLGDMYENRQEAFRWYLRAAEKGDAYAQSRLGDNYLTGHGVERNIPESLRWYTAAANQNDSYSQLQLGDLLSLIDDGENAPIKPDLVEAYKWYCLAAEQDNKEAAEGKKFLESYLSAEQLEQAQQRIIEWKSNSSKESQP